MSPATSTFIGLTVLASSALLATAQEPLASKHFTYVRHRHTSEAYLLGLANNLPSLVNHSRMVYHTKSIQIQVLEEVNMATM